MTAAASVVMPKGEDCDCCPDPPVIGLCPEGSLGAHYNDAETPHDDLTPADGAALVDAPVEPETVPEDGGWWRDPDSNTVKYQWPEGNDYFPYEMPYTVGESKPWYAKASVRVLSQVGGLIIYGVNSDGEFISVTAALEYFDNPIAPGIYLTVRGPDLDSADNPVVRRRKTRYAAPNYVNLTIEHDGFGNSAISAHGAGADIHFISSRRVCPILDMIEEEDPEELTGVRVALFSPEPYIPDIDPEAGDQFGEDCCPPSWIAEEPCWNTWVYMWGSFTGGAVSASCSVDGEPPPPDDGTVLGNMAYSEMDLVCTSTGVSLGTALGYDLTQGYFTADFPFNRTGQPWSDYDVILWCSEEGAIKMALYHKTTKCLIAGSILDNANPNGTYSCNAGGFTWQTPNTINSTICQATGTGVQMRLNFQATYVPCTSPIEVTELDDLCAKSGGSCYFPPFQRFACACRPNGPSESPIPPGGFFGGASCNPQPGEEGDEDNDGYCDDETPAVAGAWFVNATGSISYPRPSVGSGIMHWEPALLQMRPRWSETPDTVAPGDLHCGEVGVRPCAFSNGDITRVEFEGDPPSEVAHTHDMNWVLIIGPRSATLSAGIRWNTVIGSGPRSANCIRCGLLAASWTADYSVCDDINAGITLNKVYEIPELPTSYNPALQCQIGWSGTNSISFPGSITVVGLP